MLPDSQADFYREVRRKPARSGIVGSAFARSVVTPTPARKQNAARIRARTDQPDGLGQESSWAT